MNVLLAMTLTASLGALPPNSPDAEPHSPRTLAAQVVTLAEGTPTTDLSATRAARAQPGGDSLKNGAIIGAVLGGAAAAGFVGYLCSIFGTEDDNCFGGTLVWAGIGAAGGAAVGAGVDALFERPVLARHGKINRAPGAVRVGLRVRF
jgi:hypothetical protein